MNIDHEQTYSSINDEPYIRVVAGDYTGAMRYINWPDDDEQIMFAQKTLSDLPSSVIDSIEEYFESEGYTVI